MAQVSIAVARKSQCRVGQGKEGDSGLWSVVRVVNYDRREVQAQLIDSKFMTAHHSHHPRFMEHLLCATLDELTCSLCHSPAKLAPPLGMRSRLLPVLALMHGSLAVGSSFPDPDPLPELSLITSCSIAVAPASRALEDQLSS